MDSHPTLVGLLGPNNLALNNYTIPETFRVVSPTPMWEMKPVLDVYSASKFKQFRWNDVTNIITFLQLVAPNTGKVAFVVHGFRESEKSKWMIHMKNALQSRVSVVALVGWKKGADYLPHNYDKAVANVEVVGEWLGGIVSKIKHKMPHLHIHGIGYSLGAHVMGFAGRISGAFTRITGLDPAGPRYERELKKDRLKKTDATKMVDVIHTDGYAPDGYYPVNHFGTLIPLGTIDFYPNWGLAPQPGCEWYHIHDWKLGIGASHQRAHDLFTWSISNKNKFKTHSKLRNIPAYEYINKAITFTANQTQMGYYADIAPGKKGNFYTKTADKAPWD